MTHPQGVYTPLTLPLRKHPDQTRLIEFCLIAEHAATCTHVSDQTPRSHSWSLYASPRTSVSPAPRPPHFTSSISTSHQHHLSQPLKVTVIPICNSFLPDLPIATLASLTSIIFRQKKKTTTTKHRVCVCVCVCVYDLTFRNHHHG